MTDQFEMTILPIPDYVRTARAVQLSMYTDVLIRFDIIKDGALFCNLPYGLEKCSWKKIVLLVKYISRFLETDDGLELHLRLWINGAHFILDFHIEGNRRYMVFHYADDPDNDKKHTRLPSDYPFFSKEPLRRRVLRSFPLMKRTNVSITDKDSDSDDTEEKLPCDSLTEDSSINDGDLSDDAEKCSEKYPKPEGILAIEDDDPLEIKPLMIGRRPEDVNINPSGERFDILFSCELNEDQVYQLFNSLRRSLKTIDWETYGKIAFYQFEHSDREYSPMSTAAELKRETERLIRGHRIDRIFVVAEDYCDSMSRTDNYCSIDMGQRIILEMDHGFFDLIETIMHGILIRFFTKDEARFIEELKYYGLQKEDDFCEIASIFPYGYHETVQDISVEGKTEEKYSQGKWIKTDRLLPHILSMHFKNRLVLSIREKDDDVEPAVRVKKKADHSAWIDELRSKGVLPLTGEKGL